MAPVNPQPVTPLAVILQVKRLKWKLLELRLALIEGREFFELKRTEIETEVIAIEDALTHLYKQ